jgi:hypothetical protein
MASPAAVAQGLADYIQLMGGASRRTSYIAQEAASNPRLQALLAEAATSDTPNRVFARISAEFEPPAMDRAAMAYGERGMPGRRSVEQAARDGVAEELGPFFREAPMEQVEDAQSLLGPTLGGEDLVSRLEGMTPRPLYALDLPGDTSVRSQMDATYGPFAFPPENRGLIVQGGRGVPVGGPTGSGVIVPGPTGLSTRVTPRQRIPGPPQRRVGTTAGVPVGEVTPRSNPRSAPEAPRRLESPDAQAERHGMEDLAESVAADEAAERIRRFDRTNLREGVRGEMDRARKVAEDVVRRSAIPVAAGAAGIAAWNALQDNDAGVDPSVAATPPQSQPRRMVPDVTSKPKPFSTADLAAESSPPPSVTTAEPIMIDYSQMARDKIRQANEIQLREGRITPESAALSREADALYQRAAEERRRGNHPGIMPVEQQNEQTSAIRARQRRAG